MEELAGTGSVVRSLDPFQRLERLAHGELRKRPAVVERGHALVERPRGVGVLARGLGDPVDYARIDVVAFVCRRTALQHRQPALARQAGDRREQRALADPALADHGQEASQTGADVVERPGYRTQLTVAADEIHHRAKTCEGSLLFPPRAPQVVPHSILQSDERDPTLRGRVAANGKIITGDVPGGFAGHVAGSNRYDVTFSSGDLGPLGLDVCAVAVSPEFDFDQSEGHRQIRAYANLAKGAKQVNVFTYEQRIVNGQLIERPTEAAFDLVLGC